MEDGEKFVDDSEQSWNAPQGLIRPPDANIDPLLGSMGTSATVLNTSLVFDSNLLQPMETFSSPTHAMSLSGIMSAGTPSSHGTYSSGAPSAHSDLLISPAESRRSSVIASPWSTMGNSLSLHPSNQQINPPKQPRRSYTSPSTINLSRQPTVASQSRNNRDDDDLHDGTKRDEFLKRNRLAASRCRQKKKQWVHQLEETKDELEQQNTSLQMEHRNLRDEVGRMKHYLMAHATCNDPNIDGWIKSEANKVLERSRQRFENQACQQGLCSHEQHQQDGQTPSRTNSTISHDAGMNHDRTTDMMLNKMP